MTAWRMMSSGSVPGAAMSPAGRWMVEVDDPEPVRQVVAYARVSSHDQKQDLDRQVARIAEWAAASGTRIDRYTREIGSGLNDRRRELAALLADPTVGTIVVEHRDRMARFGVNQLEQALNASKRSLVVIDKGEVADDLVRDMLDLMTCFSAKLYGRRSAANRAKRAIETPQAMTRTFCAVIGDPEADKVLSPYGEVCAKARHWSFKQVHVLGRPVADVKREATRRFGLTARQFNGIRFDLDQAVNGWRGTLEFRIRNLKDSVEATVERIAALGRQMEKAKTDKRRESLHLKQVGKKQRLDVLGGRLAKAEAELKAGAAPRLLRRSRASAERRCMAMARQARQPHLPGRFQDRRSVWKSIRPVGTVPVCDCGFRTRSAEGSRPLEGVKFRYGQTEMLALLERNKNPVKRVSITWLLFQDDAGRWHAHATVDEPVAELFTDVRHGVVAVDVNVGHLAVTIVDHWGNPTSRLTLAFPRVRHGRGEGGCRRRRHRPRPVPAGTEPRLRHRLREPGVLEEEGRSARIRRRACKASFGLGLCEVLHDAGGALRARRRRPVQGQPGIHLGDRTDEIRPRAGHVDASCGGAGHRTQGVGIWRAPRGHGRSHPGRSCKEPSQG